MVNTRRITLLKNPVLFPAISSLYLRKKRFDDMKYIPPTLTYLLTLFTGIWLGVQIKQRQVWRYQQLAQTTSQREQRLLDSLSTITQLASKDHTISIQDETILNLRQQIRSDSIAHLTELQAIRAINQHLKPKK